MYKRQDKDCILFLWATFPQLKEALQLIKAWRFTYKSVAFVWLKQNRKSPTWFYGLGFWTVSYTHLDVYKRQLRLYEDMVAGRISEANFNLMLDKTQKEQAELKERVAQGLSLIHI